MTRRAAMKSPAAGSQRETKLSPNRVSIMGHGAPTWLYMTRLLYTWILIYAVLVSVSRGFRKYGGQRLIRLEQRTAIVADAGDWH